jgi:CHAT domain
MRKHIILFLAAHPSEVSRIALDEECAAIERELRMTTGRNAFDLRSKWAVSVDEMLRHLNELQPTVIHFSGHGGSSADVYFLNDQRQPVPTPRDLGVVPNAGIQLQDEWRQSQHVSARALSQMIGSAAPSTRLLVLNACFSEGVAQSLCGVVDCVVGMRGAIGDDAARAFSVSFYRALGYRRSVGNAFAQAVATLAAKRFSDEHLPVCRTRNGVSADYVILPRLAARR